MDAGVEMALAPAARLALATQVPDQSDTRIGDRWVTFSRTAAGGWSLRTHIQTDFPGTQYIYDNYSIDSVGNITGSGKTRTYSGIPIMDMETGDQSAAFNETEHFSKPHLADTILSALAAKA
jgi:hypothetical protein